MENEKLFFLFMCQIMNNNIEIYTLIVITMIN